MDTDINRWKKLANNEIIPSWEWRNLEIVKFINENESILDVGAGNMNLKNMLPTTCSYQPMDCVKGDESTILVDFNNNIIPNLIEKYDVVICSGIMEYLKTPEIFLSIVKQWGTKIILTYVVSESRNYSSKDYDKNGWVSDLSIEQLNNIFDKLGLRITQLCKIKNHTIFILEII